MDATIITAIIAAVLSIATMYFQYKTKVDLAKVTGKVEVQKEITSIHQDAISTLATRLKEDSFEKAIVKKEVEGLISQAKEIENDNADRVF